MIYSANASPFHSFTPLASEAPIALAQSLPFDSDANILLLGSGDSRKILFSIFNDENESKIPFYIDADGRIHTFI
jgi:hypothetical protein